jgi:predicted acetyltransferase
MTFEIRHVDLSEMRDALDVVSTAFLDRPDLDALATAEAKTWTPERTWIALDGARVVGVFRSWLTEMTVPGGARLSAAAVGPVTVLPTHRRRGILRGLAAAEDLAIRERGEAFSLLHASEYGIYGRYGYGPATRDQEWTIRTDASGGVHGTPSGSVELLAPKDPATKPVVKGVYDTWRRRQAGEIERRELDWDLDLGLESTPWGATWKGWVAVHRDDAGEPDGYIRYAAQSREHDLLPAAVLTVNDFVALTDAAYAGLLRFAMEVDLVRTVKLADRPESERARWFVRNARAVSTGLNWDSLWVRLFDVPGALEARTYEREARIILEVVDPGAAGGRWCLELDAGPDGARCRPSDRSADVTIPVGALGAAYLGGTSLRNIVLATGADEHREGALAELEALLRTSTEPSCSTRF